MLRALHLIIEALLRRQENAKGGCTRIADAPTTFDELTSRGVEGQLTDMRRALKAMRSQASATASSSAWS
ncbi:MAG TPA: hypothetical protein DCY63_03265, partial [Acidimicrobiaceae bacterium]|nr:hypothetical protein [Acidimicrobiaceae bacterium]